MSNRKFLSKPLHSRIVFHLLMTDVSVFMLFKGLLSDDVIVCSGLPPVMLLLEEEVLTVPGCTQFLHHFGEEL